MLFDPNSAGGQTQYRSTEFIAVILSGEGNASAGPAASLEAGGDSNEDGAGERGGRGGGGETSKAAIQPPILQKAEGGKPRIDSVIKWIEEAGVSGEPSLSRTVWRRASSC